MIGEVFFPREGLGAVSTSVRRLAGVLSHVIRQVLLASEGLCAVRAFVRGFACMLADVIH